MKKWGKKGGEITRLDTYVCVSVLAKKWGEYKKDGERETEEREREVLLSCVNGEKPLRPPATKRWVQRLVSLETQHTRGAAQEARRRHGARRG